MNIVFIGDLVESNGKTIKENNLELKHNIELGSLVEINTNLEQFDGLRLWVVEHERDCDGTPLYGLSYDIDLINFNKNNKPSEDAHELTKMLHFANQFRIEHGFSENSLKVIK